MSVLLMCVIGCDDGLCLLVFARARESTRRDVVVMVWLMCVC